MIAALVLVLCVGAAVGFVGRLVVPGRHGLLRVLFRDTRLAPRLVAADDEVWWEVGAGALGAVGGYIAGRLYDGYTLLGPSTMRWYLAVVGAAVMVGIAIASGVIERKRWTRRLGLRGGLDRGR
ncbi:MAG TPA: hypothetical protein VHD87_06940 [Acidimicrobiales bacterium]|nr:hypothetical protein [Acidimicrobiales bacterium]